MVPSNLQYHTMKDNGLTIRELQERFDERYGPRKPAKPKGPQLPNLPVKKAAHGDELNKKARSKRKVG